MRRRYRISPSLLNSFSNYLDAEDTWLKYWGESEKPPMSVEDFVDKQKADLLAYINREPQEPNEAADRGTALNDLIDWLNWSRTGRTSVEVCENCYVCTINGFTFKFDRELVESLRLMFANAVPQYHFEHSIATATHELYLHGYADYVFPTMIWDLKTTGKYEGEKYAGNWQRWMYPLLAEGSGAMTKCESFTFYALEMRSDRKTGILTAKPWTETYDVNVEEGSMRVVGFIENVFLPWLDEQEERGLIPHNTIIETL